MNNKTTLTFGPAIDRYLVGYERIFERLNSIVGESLEKPSSYPPYNIIKNGDKYLIELALAGFRKEDIDVTLEGDKLTIENIPNTTPDTGEYLHKGIGLRNFKQTFRLAEQVSVTSVYFVDGMLKICMERVVPEELQPKKLQIL